MLKNRPSPVNYPLIFKSVVDRINEILKIAPKHGKKSIIRFGKGGWGEETFESIIDHILKRIPLHRQPVEKSFLSQEPKLCL
jgi:hypothetical protein